MTSLRADDPRAVELVAAIQGGDLERLRKRLTEDTELATARIVDAQGVSRTLLHVVADWPGHFPRGARTVAVLAAAGAEVDAAVTRRDGQGSPETPLHWAASSDDVDVLDALLDAGADIEAPGAVLTGGTPMSDAVVFAQWRAARRLLARGARTTLWQAAALGLVNRVRAAFASDTPPSPEQATNAFWHACHGGQLEVAQLLLDYGADPNWIGYEGRTPLDVARSSGARDLVCWLEDVGAQSASRQQ